MKKNKLTPIFRVTLSYAIFAGLWIIFSDQILNALIPDPEQYRHLQTFKGWFFVFVTAILLFNIIYREFKLHWQYEKELEVVAEISNVILGNTQTDQLTENILYSLKNIFHAERSFIALNHAKLPNIKISILEGDKTEPTILFLDKKEPFVSYLLNKGVTISSQTTNPNSQPYPLRLVKSHPSFVLNSLIAQGEIIGFIGFARQQEVRASESHIIKAISVVIAQQLHASELIQKNNIQIQRLSLLRKIDEMLLNSIDTENLFDELINLSDENYQYSAMAIYYLDQDTHRLHINRSKILNNEKTILFMGYMEYFKSVQEPLIITNYYKEINLLRSMPQDHPMRSGKFHGFAVYPLFIKGKHVGLVEVYSSNEFLWNEDEKDFFNGFCNQIAIALDSVDNLTHLKKSTDNLLHAYDQTLEGWSRALELRDRETEDHTKRAIKLTMKMAQLLGIPEEQHNHIRRGVLLHDIGKLGVPDNILHKPGPLNEQEWEIMREHPVYAHNLLKEITYLHPSLNIPYCHHEKWDGSGYPQGLAGEEIPLEARIFAVVDVFDALTSDRPYRTALSQKEALRYIKEQSGKHFDPDIVNAFLRLVLEVRYEEF